MSRADPADVGIGGTTTRVLDFVNRGPDFDALYVHPPILEACCRVIGRPTNNGLPPEKADVATEARNADIARAIENRVYVIRADVAGRTDGMVSYGSSGIVDPDGMVLQSAQRLHEDLIGADLDISAREPGRSSGGLMRE